MRFEPKIGNEIVLPYTDFHANFQCKWLSNLNWIVDILEGHVKKQWLARVVFLDDVLSSRYKRKLERKYD